MAQQYPGQPQPGMPYPGGPYPGGMPDPNAPYGYDMQGRPYSDKSKVIAGVLQILLGGFGVGRFYLGHWKLAIVQIICLFGFFGIWGLIDGIIILVGNKTDAQGRPLRG